MDAGDKGMVLLEEENHECGYKGVDMNVFDLRQLSGTNHENEKMDSDPDTTANLKNNLTPSHHGSEYSEAKGTEKLSLSPKPQKRNKPSQVTFS